MQLPFKLVEEPAELISERKRIEERFKKRRRS